VHDVPVARCAAQRRPQLLGRVDLGGLLDRRLCRGLLDRCLCRGLLDRRSLGGLLDGRGFSALRGSLGGLGGSALGGAALVDDGRLDLLDLLGLLYGGARGLGHGDGYFLRASMGSGVGWGQPKMYRIALPNT
jgi:hypothetical protein